MIEVLDKGFVSLISSMGNDKTIVEAARVSSGNDGALLWTNKVNDKDRKLIKYLWKNKHTSPFEHVVFTFLIKCPLFVRSQWMRHRTWSYNEISRRYTSEDIDFYYPNWFRTQSESNRQGSSDNLILNASLIDLLIDSTQECYYRSRFLFY